MKKRILSMLLAIVMVVGMLPSVSLTARAADVITLPDFTVPDQLYESLGTEYLQEISTIDNLFPQTAEVSYDAATHLVKLKDFGAARVTISADGTADMILVDGYWQYTLDEGVWENNNVAFWTYGENDVWNKDYQEDGNASGLYLANASIQPYDVVLRYSWGEAIYSRTDGILLSQSVNNVDVPGDGSANCSVGYNADGTVSYIQLYTDDYANHYYYNGESWDKGGEPIDPPEPYTVDYLKTLAPFRTLIAGAYGGTSSGGGSADDVEPFYTVTGVSELCGTAWDPANMENLLTLAADGNYYKTYNNVAAGTYEFLIVSNGSWLEGEYNLEGATTTAGPNAQVEVAQDGSTVIIGFDGTKALLEIIPPAELTEYPLYIGGEKVTSANLTINGDTGTATYDPDENTLTLNNYTYTGEGHNYAADEYAAICYTGSDTLTLVLIGESTVTHQTTDAMTRSYGLYSNSAITVSAENTGSLTVTGGNASAASYGVYVQNGDLTLSGGSLTATGGNVTAAGGESNGVYANGKVIVSAGSLTAIGGSAAESYGIYAAYGANITGGVTVAQGETRSFFAGFSNDTMVFYDKYGSMIVDNDNPHLLKYLQIKAKPTYTVTIDSNIENGTVAFKEGYTSPTTSGGWFYLDITPDEGYKLDTVTVTGESGATVNFDYHFYRFRMPDENVTVTATFVKIEFVASVTTAGGETTNYTTLSEALTAAETNPGSTLTLLKDYTGTINIGGNGNQIDHSAINYTLDLNGKTITGGGAESDTLYLFEGTTLTVIDSSTGKTGKLVNSGDGIFNDGTLTLDAITVEAGDDTLYNSTKGTANVKNSTFSALDPDGVAVMNYSTVTMEDSTITAQAYYAVDNRADMTVKNCTITSKSVGVSNDEDCTLHLEDSTITVEGVSEGKGIYNYGTATILRCTVTDNSTKGYGIYNGSSGTATIEGGAITATGEESYGMRCSGTVTVKGNTSISGVTADLRYSGGTFDLSDWDNANGAAILNRADAVTVSDETIKLPEGLSLLDSTGKAQTELTKGSTYTVGIEPVASVTTAGGETTNYTALSEALTTAQANNGSTLKLLKDHGKAVKITSGTFTIDLNGCTIGGAGIQIAVQNTGGNLTITDSSTDQTGKIIGDFYSVCNLNGGTLTVSGGTVTGGTSGVTNYDDSTATVTGGTITGGKYGVQCSGSLNIAGGTITGSTNAVYSDGILKITGGTITGSGTDSIGVCSGSAGAVATITGGTISGKYAVDTLNSLTIKDNAVLNGTDADIAYFGGTVDLLQWSDVKDATVLSCLSGVTVSNETFKLPEGLSLLDSTGKAVTTLSDDTIYTVGEEAVPVIESVTFNSDSPAYDAATNTFYIDEANPLVLIIEGRNLKGQSGMVYAVNSKGRMIPLTFTLTEDSGGRQTFDRSLYRYCIEKFERNGVAADIVSFAVFLDIDTGGFTPDKMLAINVVERTYEVELPTVSGGSVTTDNPDPTEGEDVTITVTPEPGMEVDQVIVKGEDGTISVTKNEDGTYTYEQPAEDVTVEVTMKETEYDIEIEQPTGGSVETDTDNPTMGDKVTITVDPDPGKCVDKVVVKDENGDPIEVTKNPDGTYSYEQPVGNVTIEVTFENIPVYSGPTYRPTIEDTTGGDTTVSDKNPEKGDKVTIITDPDKGYEVGEVIVTDSKGNPVKVIDNGDGTYTYVQPVGKVTIEVTYKPIGCPSEAYSDLNTGAWYHEAMDYVLTNGLMNGVGNGKFNPNGTTSRAMIVTILWRLEGEPAVNYLMQFKDVAIESWYTEAVRWAASEKIVEGYGDTFGPNDPITREQFATILWRYAKYKGYDVSVGEDTNILSYEDAFSVSEYAIPAMQWACGTGLMQGDGVNLTPGADATRVQAAALFQRFCENVAEK